jgi:restriction endonuclease S subunit
MSGAVGLQRLKKERLKSIQIPLPSLEHQQKIVVYLDETFAHLNQLKSTYEQKLTHLQELKASVLAEAFT